MKDNIVKLAAKVCLKSNMRQKMAAIIYDNRGRVISVGYNRWLVIGSQRNKQPFRYSIHAEADAIAGCSREELFGKNIFIYREGNKNARPCQDCSNLIKKYGFRTVCWGPV